MQINFENISKHRQIACNSCVPMSVELVLKVLGIMEQEDFSLQKDSSKIGDSDWIKNGFEYPSINSQIKFERRFKLSDYYANIDDRGEHFLQKYFVELFKTIDYEIENNRLVIISLQSAPTPTLWHMEVIFDKVDDNSYKTITCYHDDGEPRVLKKNLKEKVWEMMGTDILTYKHK